MCGIYGKIYFDSEHIVESEVLENMGKAIIHRGPDGYGIYKNKNAGLGHRRLSIIDLNSGKQPLSNEDGRFWITYNGEIYNYIELRRELEGKGHTFKTKTDTEVIIHLYEDLRERCLEKLRGMYAFAIWDNKKNKLFIARDRVGIKPLYYTTLKDAFVFGSEVKSLFQDPSIENDVNPAGIYSFLNFSYTPGPETAFKDILKLLPGHYLIVENGKVTVKEHWDLNTSFSSSSMLNKNQFEGDLLELLKETINRHMISDVPVGFLLSGGVDSTAMLSLYREQAKSNIKTFTIGFEDQHFEDERKYARLAAKKFGVEHYETTITSKQFFDFLPEYVSFMEEPIFEPPGVSLYFVAQLAKEHVKVLISGEGGDEAFAGYQTYRNIVWLERLKKLLGPTRKMAGHCLMQSSDYLNFPTGIKYAPLIDPQFEDYYFSRAASVSSPFIAKSDQLYSSEILDLMNNMGAGHPFLPYIENMKNGSKLQKMLYVDTKTWLPDRLLLKADKMTMANSIELRVPLLDHKLLEFAAALPDDQKLNYFTTKYIFKKVLENKIPAEIIKRKKAGFPTPYGQWMHNNKKMILDILLDRKATERGYFNKLGIRELLLNSWIEDRKYEEEIFKLLILELWHLRFIDN